MTQKLCALALCLLFGLQSYAQKVKNDNFYVYYNRMPDNPMPEEFTTYSTSIKVPVNRLEKDGFTPSQMEKKYLSLRGFRQVQKGGHFHVNVEVGKFKTISMENIKEETKTKNKEGVEKTVTQYYKKVMYKMPITLTVEDMNGKVWMEKTEGNPSGGIRFNFLKNDIMKFNTESELNKAWSIKELAKLRKKLIEESFKKISGAVRYNYAIQNFKGTAFLKLAKGKKLSIEESFKTNFEKTKTILTSLKAGELADEQWAALQPIIEFFDKEKDNFSASDKKEMKVKYACVTNLAWIYYLFGHFEEALKYNEMAAAIPFREAGTKTMTESIKKTQARMEKNHVTKRHFPIDVADAIPPKDINYKHLREYEEAEIPVVVDKSARYSGYLVNDLGDSLVGTYIFRDGNFSDPKFAKNVVFEVEQNGALVEYAINEKNFNRGAYNGRNFTSKDMTGVLSYKKKRCMIEVIEDGPKAQLMRIYPIEIQPDDNPSNVLAILKKDNIDDLIKIEDISPRFINWRKGFAELFKDCEVLYAEIRVGMYKRKFNKIREAVRLYNKNDCE